MSTSPPVTAPTGATGATAPPAPRPDATPAVIRQAVVRSARTGTRPTAPLAAARQRRSPVAGAQPGPRHLVAVTGTDTAVHAAGPPTLSPGQLRVEQQRTLEAPRARPHLALRLMFASIDVLYGRRLSVPKFLVLEHLAQVPYRSWERVAQRRIARTRGRSVLARRIQQRVAEARAQQDNEQWHMLVMEDLIAREGRPVRRLRHRLLPRLLALPWHAATWALHLVRPRWSYRLNAAFEAHAEQSYMRFVAEHPETEHQVFDGPLADRWNVPVTVADVLRQIGHDERVHRLDSEQAAADEGDGDPGDDHHGAGDPSVPHGPGPGMRSAA